MPRYCYFCVMDVLFTTWLTEEDAKPTMAIARDCRCEMTDGEPHNLLRVTNPAPKRSDKGKGSGKGK